MERNPFSIIRAINFKLKDPFGDRTRIKKALRYILDPKAAPPELMFHHMVDPADVTGSFGAFGRSLRKDKGRLAKHFVLSFGKNTDGVKDWDKYYEASKAVLRFFGDRHQAVFSIHNDIPTRPHMHLLLDMLDVKTKKKFQQSQKELDLLKDHVDEIFRYFDIPLLRRYKNQNDLSRLMLENQLNIPHVEANSNYGDGWDLSNDRGDWDYQEYFPTSANSALVEFSNQRIVSQEKVQLASSTQRINEKVAGFFRKPSNLFGGEQVRFDYEKLKGGFGI